VGNSFAATAECTYDQENQLEVLRKAAAREPGGRLDESQRRIVWSLPSGSTLTYTYGGCTHLGSEVTLAEPRRTARSETLLFARAMELATRFWDAADVAALRRGLQGRGFQREEANGRVYYRLAHEYYAEFFVAHEFADGVDRITIFWSRNF
jgi:hypothetical protein